MNAIRRTTLKAAGAAFLLVAGLLKPVAALAAAWNKEAFAAKKPADALTSLGAANTEASTGTAGRARARSDR